MLLKLLYCRCFAILHHNNDWWNIETSCIWNESWYICFFIYHFFRWIRYWQWDISGNLCDAREHPKIFVDSEMKIKWNILSYLWDFLLYSFNQRSLCNITEGIPAQRLLCTIQSGTNYNSFVTKMFRKKNWFIL